MKSRLLFNRMKLTFCLTGIVATCSVRAANYADDSRTAPSTNSSATGDFSTAIGDGVNASKKGAFAVGTPNAGTNTSASGVFSLAIGQGALASGDFSVSFGLGIAASGAHAFAMGAGNNAVGDYSTAFGFNSVASSYGEFVIGRYNVDPSGANATGWSDVDDLFVIGNGTSTTPRDAFKVQKNGDATVGRNLNVTGSLSVTSSATLGGKALLGNEDTTGANLVVGNGSAAYSDYLGAPPSGSVVYGLNAQTVGSNSVAVGSGASASYGGVALGYVASASGNGVAVGTSVNSGWGSVGVGKNVSIASSNIGNIAAFGIGVSAATGGYGIDGYWSGNETVVGVNSSATGYYGTSVGYGNIVGADGGSAFGYQNMALGDYSIALGTNTVATGFAETVLGQYNDFTSQLQTRSTWNDSEHLLVVGNGTSANQKSNALVIQKNGNAYFSGSLASGRGSNASGQGAFAAGMEAYASGPSSAAFGGVIGDTATIASADNSFAQGASTASGGGAVSFGFGASASGDNSFVVGNWSTASGSGSIAMGGGSGALAAGAVSIGSNNQAVGNSAFAIGNGTVSSSYSEVVLGSYNANTSVNNQTAWDPSDNLLVVGNGTGEYEIDPVTQQLVPNRSNALVVKKNGDIHVSNRILVPEQGDISMGDFTTGTHP